MTIVALVIGVVMLRSIEVRMVEATGENLTLASAEIADKLDRLLFERHADVRMMARAFTDRSVDKKYINEYLQWMKETYAPVYLWLGVTDAHGRMIAATDSSVIGQDYSRSGWCGAAARTRHRHVFRAPASAPRATQRASDRGASFATAAVRSLAGFVGQRARP